MKSRDTLIRLKRFQLEEKRRRVRQIEMMLAEFTRMIGDLDREIANEEKRAGIADPAHFAYPTYARATSVQTRQSEELDCRAPRPDRGGKGGAGRGRGRTPQVRDARSARQDKRALDRSRRARLRRRKLERRTAMRLPSDSRGSGRRGSSNPTLAALRAEHRCSMAVSRAIIGRGFAGERRQVFRQPSGAASTVVGKFSC